LWPAGRMYGYYYYHNYYYTVSGKNGPSKQNAVTCTVYNTIQ